jgi:hypothetical protein
MRPAPTREDRIIRAQSKRSIVRMVPRIPPIRKGSQSIRIPNSNTCNTLTTIYPPAKKPANPTAIHCSDRASRAPNTPAINPMAIIIHSGCPGKKYDAKCVPVMKPIRPTKSKNSLRPITSNPIPTRILNSIITVLSPSTLISDIYPTFQAVVGAHDEILLEAPIEATDEVAHILKETMEEAGRTLLKTVPVEAQVVVVGSWAEK